MLERRVEARLKKKAEEHGWLVMKFTSPGTAGVPDRILIRNGRVVFVELKAPGEKTRALQNVIINRMREKGAEVYVVGSCLAVDELMIMLESKRKSDYVRY